MLMGVSWITATNDVFLPSLLFIPVKNNFTVEKRTYPPCQTRTITPSFALRIAEKVLAVWGEVR